MPRTGWLALGAIAAALAGPAGIATPPVLAVAWVALAIVALAGGRAGLVGLGAALVVTRLIVGGALAPPPGQASAAPVPGETSHEAVVLSLGATDGGLQRAIVELAPPEPPTRVYAWLPRYPPLTTRDEIRFDGRLEPAPQDGGFGEYLARSAVSNVVHARVLERLGDDQSPLAGLAGLRRDVADLLAAALPQPQAGLAAALTVGMRERVARDVTQDFRSAGLSHVVAISGFHVALLGAMVAAVTGGLGRRRRSLLILTAICSYAILAGASASVVRAALMATVVLLARESGRRGEAAAALGLAVTALLLFEPATVGDIGFQLSVSATAGILALGSRLGAALRGHVPRVVPAWITDVMAISLAAQAATLPLVLLHFGRLSTVAPLANLLVAPIVAPAMLATTLALAAGALGGAGLPPLALVPLSMPAVIALGALSSIAATLAALPLASLELPPPMEPVLALLAATAVVLGLRWASDRAPPLAGALAGAPAGMERPPHAASSRRLRLAAAASVACLVGVLAVAGQPDGQLHVVVLDVGQGDAILVEGARGGRLLIDTGPDPDRLVALLDARVPAWDRRIDLVVLTHPHEDHVAGIALLLDRYRIGGVAEPGMIGLGPGDAAYRRRMAELDRQPSVLAAGDRLELDGARIDVLWPPAGWVPLRPANGGTAVNNVSLVLALSYGQRRMLLTGDIEQGVDPTLLTGPTAQALAQPFDVLKVAHHGSGTASTDAFLERVQPEVAVISAGWGNPYGHPSAQTVARLQAAGAHVLRTDNDGSVEITTDGRALTVSASGGRPRTATLVPSLPLGPGYCPIPALVSASIQSPP